MKRLLTPAKSHWGMAAQRLALRAAYYSGALHAYGRAKRGSIPGVTILMYHSIGGPDLLGPALAVSEKNFAGQLEYLARNFAIVPLERAVAMLRGGAPIPNNTIAITFDDGFRDNYEVAFPLLKRYGAPAAIFVPTQPLSERISLWPYRLRFLLKETQLRELRLNWPGASLRPGAFDLASGRKRRRAVEALETALMPAPPAERDRLLADLAHRLGLKADSDPADEIPALTAGHLKSMAAAGVEIGSHTVTHSALSSLGRDDAAAELTASKKTLESILDRRVKFLAYPFGRPEHFNRGVEALAQAAGYEAALTTVRGINRDGDVYALKRLNVYDDPPAIFAFKLSRWFA